MVNKPIVLERILALSATIKTLRSSLAKAENALRDAVLASNPEEPRVGTPVGSQTKSRKSRTRNGTVETEYLYTSNAYRTVAEDLDMGQPAFRVGRNSGKAVWLTQSEICTVREANYARRLKKGATSGVPRFRLAQGGK